MGCRGEALISHVAIAECILAYSSASLTSCDFCQISRSQRSTAPSWFAVRSPLKRLRNRDRMCKCNTVTRDDIPFAIWSGLRPDTPHQCVRAQCGFRFSSASSPTRSLTFGRWGCGERCHLSHVVGDSAVVLSGISRQIALQTRSEALRRTKRGLNARQGMEGAKNAYRAFQEVRRADTPSQGLSGRQEPRQPPAKPICTVQAATRLVGDRRPSVLQRWGLGFSPDGFRLRSRRCRNRGGSVVLEIGEQKHARDLRRQKSNAG